MATIAAVHSAGVVTVTGTGYGANAEVVVNVQFTSTDNKRRSNEMFTTRADGAGAISFARTMPFATGTVVARTLSRTTWAIEGTSGNVSV